MLLNFSSHFFLLNGLLCFEILGFKSEQYLPRWISRRPSGGLFIFFIQIYFGVFIQLLFYVLIVGRFVHGLFVRLVRRHT